MTRCAKDFNLFGPFFDWFKVGRKLTSIVKFTLSTSQCILMMYINVNVETC